jgi:hypothetical protein
MKAMLAKFPEPSSRHEQFSGHRLTCGKGGVAVGPLLAPALSTRSGRFGVVSG